MAFHPFHLVERSPWPLTSALSALMVMTSLIEMMHNNSMIYIYLSVPLMILNSYQWWRDVTREATLQGLHTLLVKKNMKWGMMLFILSEILFFFSFFWAFFHTSLAPDLELGMVWPPTGITPFNPYYTPLLNTTILLASGLTVTWTHHSILNQNYKNAFNSLFLTICLGLYFTSLQTMEYFEAPFMISDSMYGTSFFVATGFHGLHVLVGTCFLNINLLRMYMGQMNNKHHFSFEAAAWYWHFVDIVWLFLYTFMYWWPF